MTLSFFQISTLVSLQLLLSVSSAGSLNSPKLKCNVDEEFVQNLARSLHFDLSPYVIQQ